MKRKKLFSMAVAGMLAMAQMVMPAMAEDGGGFDVDVTTKTSIIRVVVPTSLAIAVNQFEQDDPGSQIYSKAFEMTNKSKIPVKVTVTSEAVLGGTNPSLAATKAAAETATSAAGTAWLAVAAKTSAAKYIEEAGKSINDLSEASANVATFDGTTKQVEQVFYLAGPSTTWTGFVPATAANNGNHDTLYKLAVLADLAAINTALQTKDVYKTATASVAITAVGTKTFTRVAKRGATLVAADIDTAANTYFSVEANPTPTASLLTTEGYMYGTSTSSVTYKGVKTDTDGKTGISYVQLYELTPVDVTNGQTDLDAAIADADVYEVSGAGVTDVTGETLTLTAAKGSSATIDTSGSSGACDKTYFKVAESQAGSTLTADTNYMYAEDVAGGAAAFRYIGKLSEGNKETWTASDIKRIKIKYTIAGVTASRYDVAENSCIYGLYAGAAPSIAVTSYNMTAGQAVNVNVDLGKGTLKATGIDKITYNKSGVDTILATTNYTYANGVLTIKSSYVSDVLTAGVTSRDYTVKFNNAAGTEVTIRLVKP